jgi:hypothetical protein
VFADGWSVSNQHSSVGLYFTISNLPKEENWKVIHKFPLCLFPPGFDIHKGVCHILQEVKYTNPPTQLVIGKSSKLSKIQIARFITDTPGCAEVNNVKNHRAGIYVFYLLTFFYKYIYFR